MVNLTDLRIGNVIFASNKKEVTEGRVFELSQKHVTIRHHSTGLPMKFLYEELNPIPLTPEILEKYGMPIHGPEEYTGDRPITITELSIIQIAPDNTLELIVTMFRGDSYPKRGMPEPRIKYLHQLQNFHFSLFGTELEINLTE